MIYEMISSILGSSKWNGVGTLAVKGSSYGLGDILPWAPSRGVQRSSIALPGIQSTSLSSETLRSEGVTIFHL
jgi:hypothetical protein